MILDKNCLFADNLAYNGTSTVLDLEHVGVGKGEPVKCFISAPSTLAGCTGVVITDGATNSAADAFLTYTCDFDGKTIEFELPSDVARYVKFTLQGSVSAGTWTAGIVLAGNQTAV